MFTVEDLLAVSKHTKNAEILCLLNLEIDVFLMAEFVTHKASVTIALERRGWAHTD